ncbi:hypothetical protein VIGAN_03145500, partial [Vigna angularis var. angularis]
KLLDVALEELPSITLPSSSTSSYKSGNSCRAGRADLSGWVRVSSLQLVFVESCSLHHHFLLPTPPQFTFFFQKYP